VAARVSSNLLGFHYLTNSITVRVTKRRFYFIIDKADLQVKYTTAGKIIFRSEKANCPENYFEFRAATYRD
jgi:hypothetical protein